MAIALAPGDVSGPSAFDVVGEAFQHWNKVEKMEESFSVLPGCQGNNAGETGEGVAAPFSRYRCTRHFESLTDPGHPENKDPDPHNVYEIALRTLDAYFLLSTNELMKGRSSHRMRQKDDETVDQFVTRLRKQGRTVGLTILMTLSETNWLIGAAQYTSDEILGEGIQTHPTAGTKSWHAP